MLDCTEFLAAWRAICTSVVPEGTLWKWLKDCCCWSSREALAVEELWDALLSERWVVLMCI